MHCYLALHWYLRPGNEGSKCIIIWRYTSIFVLETSAARASLSGVTQVSSSRERAQQGHLIWRYKGILVLGRSAASALLSGVTRVSSSRELCLASALLSLLSGFTLVLFVMGKRFSSFIHRCHTKLKFN